MAQTLLVKGSTVVLVVVVAALFVALNSEPAAAGQVSMNDMMRGAGINPSTGETQVEEVERRQREQERQNQSALGQAEMERRSQEQRNSKQVETKKANPQPVPTRRPAPKVDPPPETGLAAFIWSGIAATTLIVLIAGTALLVRRMLKPAPPSS